MDILKKLQAIRKLLGISYKDHVTNDAVRDRIRQAIGPCNDILTTEIEVVQWACIKVSTACYDNFTRNSARSEKKRSIKEGLGEQHLINDWPGLKLSHALRLSEKKKKDYMEGKGC